MFVALSCSHLLNKAGVVSFADNKENDRRQYATSSDWAAHRSSIFSDSSGSSACSDYKNNNTTDAEPSSFEEEDYDSGESVDSEVARFISNTPSPNKNGKELADLFYSGV